MDISADLQFSKDLDTQKQVRNSSETALSGF